MIRNLDPIAEKFLADLAISERRAVRAFAELSSGYRVSRASDSPDDVVDILQIQSASSRTTQVQANLGRLKSDVDVSESVLQTAVRLLEKANVLAAQGAGIGQSAQQRADLAVQVRELRQQMIGLSQTSVQGRYLFSGDRDQEMQYDSAGVRQFSTQESRQVADALGTTFSAAKTAEEIFEDPTASIFGALDQLEQALLADDVDAIVTSIDSIKQAHEHASSMLAFYGSVQVRIQDSLTMASKFQLQWEKDLGELRDADPAAAITDLQSARTQQDVAMAARSFVSGRSLFDFLR